MATASQVGDISFLVRDRIAWLTIDNQPRRNAMSLEMWQKLDHALAAVGEEVRCVVVRGAGNQAFVSGADISEFASARREPADVAYYDEVADAAMLRLASMPQPTIAMISGFCVGGGVALALCCDIRIASDDSLFAVPAVRIGLGYGAEGLNKLLQVVGSADARDIMLSGRRLDAGEAHRVRLVTHVHPSEALLARTEAYAAAIAANAPLTMQAIKVTLGALTGLPGSADLQHCNELTAACFTSEDYLEGMTAFMEKRKPVFRGR